MKQMTFVLTVILLCISCKKDDLLLKVGNFQFTETATLPSVLDESSGLEIAGSTTLWSHNDRNGKAELYRFDTLGLLTQTLEITNAENVDWEDLTQDDDGNLYIGDFGNNDNDRQDLVIYKISNDDLSTANNEVAASKIFFSYPDQTAFPPAESNFQFDVEAMFAKGEYLYLLSRDRSRPFIGNTKLYQIPNTPGEYTATLLATILTDSDKNKGQITAVDLSPDKQTLAMISNTSIWLYQNIIGDNFFGGEVLHLDLPIDLDMEGLVFWDNCTIFLSNEKGSGEPAILYKIELCKP